MKIYLAKLQNGEYIQFLNDVLVLVQESPLVKEDLKTNIKHLSTQVTKLEGVFKIRGHVLTAKIKEADAKRDQAFIGLKNVVKGYQSHNNAELVDQANQIMHLFRRYGLNVSTLNYQAETENLKVLIKELNALEAKHAMLTNLGIKTWVEDLNALNESFNELYLERTTSKAKFGIQSVTASRKETDRLYNELITLLDAITLTKESRNKPVDDYKQTKQNLDELSKQYMDMVSLRKSRNQEDDLGEYDENSGEEPDDLNGEE